jgi:hypothetical protein
MKSSAPAAGLRAAAGHQDRD